MDGALIERFEAADACLGYDVLEPLRLSTVALTLPLFTPRRKPSRRNAYRPVFTLETTLPCTFLCEGFDVTARGRQVTVGLDGVAKGGFGHVSLRLSSHDVSGEVRSPRAFGPTAPAIGSHAFVRALLGRRVRVTVEALD